MKRRSRLVAPAFVLAIATSLLTAPVSAGAPPLSSRDAGARPPQGATGGLKDLDKRFEGVRVSPTALQQAQLRKLGQRVVVGWTELGTPHSLRARKGPLTGPSNEGPTATARTFLKANAALFRQRPAGIDALELTMNHRQNGAVFLRFKQTDDGRDVHGSSMLVVLDSKNRIWLVGGTLAPDLGAPQPPVVDAQAAVARAARNVSARDTIRTPQRIGAAQFRNTFAVPDMTNARPVTTELVTVPTATGGRPAWKVLMEVSSNAEYEMLVDAATGEILYRKNQISSGEPHGLVHTGDDPEAGGQVPNVPFSGIDGSWVASDTTAGNNTDTFQDLFDDDTPNAADRPVNADQHFDYNWTDPWGNSGMIPDTGDDRDAVVSQLFYYTNWYHDYAYNLGFTETARNFQEDNFGRGGTGGDSVWAQSDDGYGTGTEELCTNSDGDPILCRNNANFSTGGSDGNRPRMQMYVGETGGGRRTQRANNRDTVIHEYTHGITGRIISDTNLQGGVQSGALGEGWSDAFATSINDDPVYGEYNNGDYTNGIRGVAYDDDNLEYGDLCDDGCQVHNDGRIWAMAMWEERAALIDKLGFSDGKSFHEELMMLGLFATPDTPSYHDARTGYLVADALLDFFGDPDAGNQCLIWRVFADNELGVTASSDDDNDSTPTVSTATPSSCDPEAVIADPPVTPEGSSVLLDGTGSIANGDDGDTLAYAWDLDDDGDYDDSTSPTPSATFGDNGLFTVSLRVTNTAGYTDTADAVVTVTNVSPTVTIDPGQITSRVENQALPVLANFTDPGWLDTYPTSSIDPGTADISGIPGTVVIGDEGPPANVGTVAGTLTYGDNGTFTVTVSLTDDDGGVGSDSFSVTVDNLDPRITIDETGTVDVNGVPTFFADAGESVEIPARVEDEGSDDETVIWDWDDGEPTDSVFSRNDPAFDDPPVSPTVNPRDFVVAASHSWAEACMYDVTLDVTDDDGGTDTDSVKVLITGTPTLTRGAGYWQHQYKGNGKIDFSDAQLDCYLEIAAFLSNVFNEERDASTRAIAHDDIFVAGKNGSASEQLDREVLTAWLNFANGGVEYDEMLDTDGDDVPDTSFIDVMTAAESVRLDPLSTRDELLAQKDLLVDINRRDGV